MTRWLLQPRDALAVRDGRQLWEAGSTIRSLEIPWPSTIAGAIRHRLCCMNQERFDPGTEEGRGAVRGVAVWSGWLTETPSDSTGRVRDYLRAPADCIWFDSDRTAQRRIALIPAQRHPNECGGLAPSCSPLPDKLELVFPSVSPPDAKAVNGPKYWSWAEVHAWLVRPEADATFTAPFGLAGLAHDSRVHTSISSDTLAADEGKLFRADSTRFESPGGGGWIGLGVTCGEPLLTGGEVALGGDRRIAALIPDSVAHGTGTDRLPLEVPQSILNACVGQSLLRVVLVTPAIFARGFTPALGSEGNPMTSIDNPSVKLVAAAVGRPEVISGWDMARRAPKHTCRMAPAGSVYWLHFERGATEEWIRRVWMQPISEELEDSTGASSTKDGFGLALIGRGTQ